MCRNDIIGALLGFAVGDALGVPYEFETKNEVKDLIKYGSDGRVLMSTGTHSQKKGTWSDDTALMLAEIDSYVSLGKIELTDVMSKFKQYKDSGKYTPFGKVFDIGNSTSMAISNFDRTGEIICEALNSFDYCGNGALMRMLPYALMSNISMEDVGILSALTHPYVTCTVYSKLYVLIFNEIRNGNTENTPDSKYDCVSRAIDIISDNEVISVTDCLNIVNTLDFLSECTEMNKEQFIIRVNSKFFVIDTLEAAIGAFIVTDNFNDCVECCIKLGNDTDTTAAIAGGLAGYYYGEREINREWISDLQKLDTLMKLFNDFYVALGKNMNR